jgi:imidazolonepropionase-like amidohydrolase
VRLMTFLAFGLVCSQLGAQTSFPFETESHRKPKTVTNRNCLIRAGRILTAAKGTIENADILVENGKIVKIGKNLTAPAGYAVIDARDKVVAPGIVDGHSHRASDGTNEGAESITNEVRIRDVLNLTSLNAWQALASGHTTALILHGSANPVGGESVVIKYKFGRPNASAPIPDAPRMVKFALGENVTQKNSDNSTRFPKTRMGVEAVYRRGFTEARAYAQKWADFRAGKAAKAPRYDLRLQTLADILSKKVWVQCHSYRSDEMLMMARLSKEFGFKLGALQHGLEAYKIAPELAELGISISIFVDSWSFKQEGYDGIPWNAWLCNKAGVNVSINTDGVSGTTALNIDAAKTMRFGGMNEQEALQTITLNTAKLLGVDHRVGSIEIGKDADLGIWDGHPLSVYAKCAMTMIEGEVFFERRDAFGVDKGGQKKMVLEPIRNRTEAKLPNKAKNYAIVGATIHPVSGPVIEGGSVVIVDGKIAQVGKNVSIPGGTATVNGRGLHVYPGFIEGYTSMGLQEISAVQQMVDNAEAGVNQPDLDATSALWVESTHYATARYNGITNAFVAPSGGSVPGQGALINTDGYTTEQLGFLRKAGLVVNVSGGGAPSFELDLCCDQVDASILLGAGGAVGGHKHSEAMFGGYRIGDDHLTTDQLDEYYNLLGGYRPAQADQALPTGDPGVNRLFDRATEYMRDRKVDPNTPIDLALEAMVPYLKREKIVVLNARRSNQIRAAVGFAQKYKLRAVIAGANEAWREIPLLKSSGIPVLLNPAGKSLLSANGTDNPWDPYDTAYVAPGLLAKAGVKFGFMSGGGAEVMNLGVRVGQSCAYGLSVEDAVKALTIWPAEAFGVGDQLGSLEPGKVANLFVSDGDPFELTTTIRHVFIQGQPSPMVSKHTMLRDRYLARIGK